MTNHAKELQAGFVLHSRPWRETSLLVDVFTENHGKIGLCARGVRGKKSAKSSMLQPLTPILLCWTGRGELQTLTKIELAAPAIKLFGSALYSVFYINELMVRLLHKHDPHPELYYHYQQTLEQLANSEYLERTLRKFELLLLNVIGYGLTLSTDNNGEAILGQNNYLLDVDGLFQLVENSAKHTRQFKGSHIISMAENDWQHPEVLKDAKRLLRLSLQPLLGDKPLQSRKLFRRKKS